MGTFAKSEDPDEVPQNAEFHLCLTFCKDKNNLP